MHFPERLEDTPFNITQLIHLHINQGIAVIFHFISLFFFQKIINVPLCLFRSLKQPLKRFQIKKLYYMIMLNSHQSWFAVKNGKKSPNQETGLGNRGYLKVMNDPLNHLGSIWYHSEPQGGPLFPKPVFWLELFFCVSYSIAALISDIK